MSSMLIREPKLRRNILKSYAKDLAVYQVYAEGESVARNDTQAFEVRVAKKEKELEKVCEAECTQTVCKKVGVRLTKQCPVMLGHRDRVREIAKQRIRQGLINEHDSF